MYNFRGELVLYTKISEIWVLMLDASGTNFIFGIKGVTQFYLYGYCGIEVDTLLKKKKGDYLCKICIDFG